MTGSGYSKCLVIHFQSAETRDAYVGAVHPQFSDLVFYAHDPKQLRSDKDLWTIQVTDIPFFLIKDNVMSYFKKFGNIASCSHSRSRLKGPDNSRSSQSHQPLANTPNINNPHHDRSKSGDRCDRSVFFFTALRTPPLSSSHNQPFTMPSQEAANILSLLKALQQDMAEVRDHITALEFNNRRMTCIEQHLGLLSPPNIPANNQTSDMLIDPLANTDPVTTQVSSRSAAFRDDESLKKLS
ncbi:hypothetical protein RclHR1_06530005 [Rhizophagus clarus]|uniref:Uncharacterized protein n=1 Tax=Rhizophagus clarus TaxID=94130 RepID=A0A2Z6S533_9GLOM|nr:hypothetical protein RclHR1_06530005 [Rhizophagus clarus]